MRSVKRQAAVAREILGDLAMILGCTLGLLILFAAPMVVAVFAAGATPLTGGSQAVVALAMALVLIVVSAPLRREAMSRFQWMFGVTNFDSCPHVEASEPLTAWKQARLVYLPEGVRFQALTSSWHYGVEADATCDKTAHAEKAPVPSCSCGFYAVKNRRRLEQLHRDYDGYLDLEVELSGRVLQYRKGYRAEHQSVLAAWVQRKCFVCGEVAICFVGFPKGALYPVCGLDEAWFALAYQGHRTWTLAELSNELGCEFRWRPDETKRK